MKISMLFLSLFAVAPSLANAGCRTVNQPHPMVCRPGESKSISIINGRIFCCKPDHAQAFEEGDEQPSEEQEQGVEDSTEQNDVSGAFVDAMGWQRFRIVDGRCMDMKAMRPVSRLECGAKQ